MSNIPKGVEEDWREGFDADAERLRLRVFYLYADKIEREIKSLPGDAEITEVLNDKQKVYFERYAEMGAEWLWWEKRLLGERARAELVDEAMEMYTLSVAGDLAGIAFLKFGEGDEVDLDLFAVRETMRGKGLGGAWLGFAMMRGMYGRGRRRILVNTCNFDHPLALFMYRLYGFKLAREEEREVENPIFSDGVLSKHWKRDTDTVSGRQS